MTSATSFASVKLPSGLVDEARHAALAFRRSTAGQIEYWALLGKAAEDSGLTTSEARKAIARHETQALNAGAQKAQALDAVAVRFDAPDAQQNLAARVRSLVTAQAQAATH
jgi:monoamine oxidase